MWFNLAVAALCGILYWESPLCACILLIIIIYQCILKKQSNLLLIIFPMVICSAFYTHPSPVPSFNWLESDQGRLTTDFTLLDDLVVDGDLLNGTLEVNHQKVHFSYFIKSEQEQKKIVHHLPYFQQCRSILQLKKPLPNTNGLKFDYAESLNRQNIHYTAELEHLNIDDCKPVTLGMVDTVKRYRVELADRMIKTDRFNIRYVTALTLGDIRFLSSEELDVLKNLGIYHLYAISGSHVALVSVQLYFILKRLYVPLHWCTAFMVILIPVYTILTGLSPSVIRASLFILLYMLLKRFGITLLDSLSLSFLLFLLVDASAIADIGFQLSYFISLSLIFTSNLYHDKGPVMLLIITGLISQLASLPILLMNFNVFQPIGIVTNLLFIPFFTYIMFPLCTIMLIFEMLFYHLPPFFDGFLIAVFYINDLMIKVFQRLPVYQLTIGNQWPMFYLFLTAMVLTACYQLKRGWLYLIVSLLLISGLMAGWMYVQPHAERMTFIDVGQGDSAILESGGQVMITDTGGRIELPKEDWQKRRKVNAAIHFNVLAFLKESGYSKVDYLLLTHPDADHFGEAVHLLENIKVDSIILNTAAPGNEKYQPLIELAAERGTRLIDAGQMASFQVGRARVELLNTDGHFNDENDSSIVSRVTLDRIYMLMADLPLAGETILEDRICSRPADVLKVGHHGSKTSTSDVLLNCLKPKYAVISAGRNNRFGHPHTEVIEKLQSRDITILNTQSEGKVEFTNRMTTGKNP
ncbi:DNA internalization-related competence protein ComEC/Rec2 [Macrococcus hajekii]|uniref:DNA internalization-related competence protein ComEC/Rec2 n=1 Tax=Macrococcus hajekii TaxID=198482 RepID=A0A4R6BM21_9STAP|nr:DNA internalization-related competence protein ComEC/Rec2 [Macrococcus hajekii]TDM02863.1 DNA internalization-related competence protein ComEC/Rec2 [Macrococcus hajekii]GGB04489.1 DNA internalization-related competence protein ComEC/Rec2 [Macrococcus hajekii]